MVSSHADRHSQSHRSGADDEAGSSDSSRLHPTQQSPSRKDRAGVCMSVSE